MKPQAETREQKGSSPKDNEVQKRLDSSYERFHMTGLLSPILRDSLSFFGPGPPFDPKQVLASSPSSPQAGAGKKQNKSGKTSNNPILSIIRPNYAG